jgi:hypothetical protein
LSSIEAKKPIVKLGILETTQGVPHGVRSSAIYVHGGHTHKQTLDVITISRRQIGGAVPLIFEVSKQTVITTTRQRK